MCSYVSECCSGRPLCLHVCLFPGKGTDTQNRWEAGVAPPTRYTTKDETAGALRQLAQAGNGRFHWISETGTSPDLFTSQLSVKLLVNLIYYVLVVVVSCPIDNHHG